MRRWDFEDEVSCRSCGPRDLAGEIINEVFGSALPTPGEKRGIPFGAQCLEPLALLEGRRVVFDFQLDPKPVKPASSHGQAEVWDTASHALGFQLLGDDGVSMTSVGDGEQQPETGVSRGVQTCPLKQRNLRLVLEFSLWSGDSSC